MKNLIEAKPFCGKIILKNKNIYLPIPWKTDDDVSNVPVARWS